MMSRFYRPAIGSTVPTLPLAALTLAILAATGCSVQAPEDATPADDVELALASEVEDDRRQVAANNIFVSANFNPETGQLVVSGQLPRRAASVRIEDGATGQLIGLAQAISPFSVSGRDDDDSDRVAGVAPWQLVVNVAIVPCTLRVQTPQGTVLVPVLAGVSAGQTLSCANTQNTGQAPIQAQAQNITVTRATWSPQTGSLIVAGTGAIPRQIVTVMDAFTGQILGVDESNAVGSFRLRLTNVANPSCNIRVLADSRQTSPIPLANAPAACAFPGTVINATNLAPNTVITAPATESTVLPGTTLAFDVVGIDPENNVPLTYFWDFDGAAPNSNLRNPVVTFSRPGVFRVVATATDSRGATDLTPDVRTVIVQGTLPGPIGGGSTLAPNGTILTPSAFTTVNAGQPVNFSAVGSSTSGLALTYVWNFGGGAANVVAQNPGPVVFTKSGTYPISLTVVDALGYSDPTPDTRTIVVQAGTGGGGGIFNSPPNGEISSPLAEPYTVQVGQSVVLSATGTDPDGNFPLTYMWDFGGAAQPSPQQTTSVVFTQPGTFKATLSVFDSLNGMDPTPAVRTIVVQGTGQQPQSSVVPDSTILAPFQDVTIPVGNSVNFSGTGADSVAGSTLIYSWDFDGGAPNSTAQNPGAVTFSKPGSYRIRLTARNNTGRVDLSPAERIVNVVEAVPSNRAPAGQVISPSADQTIQVGTSINFAALATDQDGTLSFSYEWDFGSAAPKVILQNPGTVEFKQAGTYKVTLRVKDALGMYDPTPEIRVVTVQSGTNTNQAPESIISSPATDLTVSTGESLNFMGTGLDADGGVISYQWSAPGLNIPSANASNAGSVSFNQPGAYVVSLVTTDSRGVFDPTPETRTITVRDLSVNNPAPNGQIMSPTVDQVQNVNVGSALSFSGTATDANGGAPIYYWDFDGATADVMNQQSPGNVVFSRPGTYKIALRVTDDRGAYDTTPDTRIINVRPAGGGLSTVAPVGTVTSLNGDIPIGLGQSVRFSASGTDADNNVPLSYHWNFDGAAPASNAQDAGFVTFTKAGVYNVSMTVTDSTGMSDMTPEMRKITVLGAGSVTTTSAAPNASITSPFGNQNILVGGTINFIGAGTDPSGSTALSYNWNFGQSGLQSSSLQSPGTLTFNTAGTYTVTLSVSNAQGVADPTPETRVITVSNTGGGTGGGSSSGVISDGMILTPATNTVVTAGDVVHFMGHVMDAPAGQTMRYLWNFGNGTTSTALSPGDVVFNSQGTYNVSFTVIDVNGLTDPTPAMRTITVNPKN